MFLLDGSIGAYIEDCRERSSSADVFSYNKSVDRAEGFGVYKFGEREP